MANGTINIVTNGLVYHEDTSFVVKVNPNKDSLGNFVKTKKTNLKFKLEISAGVTISSIVPSTGTYNTATGEWLIPEMYSDRNETISFLLTVTDSTKSPFEVKLTSLTSDPNTNTSDDTKILYFGGITDAQIAKYAVLNHRVLAGTLCVPVTKVPILLWDFKGVLSYTLADGTTPYGGDPLVLVNCDA